MHTHGLVGFISVFVHYSRDKWGAIISITGIYIVLNHIISAEFLSIGAGAFQLVHIIITNFPLTVLPLKYKWIPINHRLLTIKVARTECLGLRQSEQDLMFEFGVLYICFCKGNITAFMNVVPAFLVVLRIYSVELPLKF